MRSITFVLQLTAALGFSWLFYSRFWKWRDCIAEAKSSCLTPDGENLIAAGALWIVPALVFLALALRTLLKRRVRTRIHDVRP